MTGDHAELVFPSKRDWWIVLLLWGSAFVSVVSMSSVLRAPEVTRESLFPLFFMVLVWGLVMWVLYGTRYTLTEDLLLIQSGPMRYKVPLVEVTSVRPTRSLLSSPALSLDRIEITYGRRRILVSPEDKVRFLTELRARSPQLGEEP
jgi:hypothetical protein